MNNNKVCLLGATSFVGECLLPVLVDKGMDVVAFSRRKMLQAELGVEWRVVGDNPISLTTDLEGEENLGLWLCVAPIWVLPDYFDLMKSCGAKRVVALSSTSRFTKSDSSSPEEQRLARQFSEGEARLQTWAEHNGIEWVILRPTLIYGLGRDKNISEIARFIRRFGFFPLLGNAQGLRQPVRVQDVSAACMAALEMPAAANHAYNISGAETLEYCEMVRRIFIALGRKPLMYKVPLWFFKIAVTLLRVLPRYRHWKAAMAERMNSNLAFDHGDAAKDFGFAPKPFTISAEDILGR
jgi:nucleoside-diphosphate-sugar epimerase